MEKIWVFEWKPQTSEALHPTAAYPIWEPQWDFSNTLAMISVEFSYPVLSFARENVFLDWKEKKNPSIFIITNHVYISQL